MLVARQRDYRTDRGLVMEGRDIGTVVFPDADIKLYLDASPDERARRRAADSSHAIGREGAGVDGIAQALEERDRSDRTRAVSPLRSRQTRSTSIRRMGIDAVLESTGAGRDSGRKFEL